MDTCRPCGCKGCRTCLLCEEQFNISKQDDLQTTHSYVYCHYCNKAYPGWRPDEYKAHPNHSGEPIDYKGVYILENFLTQEEEHDLIEGIDCVPWDLSQSGRRKQNYGPKCNFRKRKLQVGDFRGFPQFSKFVQDKFNSVEILTDFQTIEQCSLEYTNIRGASIDAHVDDCWIWGERIISVNLLSDSVLTMTMNHKSDKYNLDCVKNYKSILTEDGSFNETDLAYQFNLYRQKVDYIVRVPMPRRSLLVIYGEARYAWEHRILRQDILDRRICLAYREFTPPYLPDGEKYEKSREVLERAIQFH